MTTPRFSDLAHEYAADWARMQTLARSAPAAARMASRIVSFQDRYAVVAAATRVPWYVIGLLHMREASLDFSTHLHNGDPLTKRTTHVPAGRPSTGHPPFSWVESAIDALRYDRLDLIGTWPLEVICFRAEAYNGFGPRTRGRKSGYLWAGSSIYDCGKYVADGKWSATAWDRQLGVMTVLRAMIERGVVEIEAPSVVTVAAVRSVAALQQALNTISATTPGFEPLVVDDSFGRLTSAALRSFQARVGLYADGVPGPLTWAAIDDALSSRKEA